MRSRRASSPVQGGTLVYMSPQLLSGDKLDADTSDDMYSVGVLLWELFSGRIPWAGYREPQIVSMVSVLQKRLPVLQLQPVAIDQLLQELMGPPSDRPSATQARARLRAVQAELLGAPLSPLAAESSRR